ncbi:MAG: NfeD family protein [Fibrobacteria bacterium]|nr:NfeD family protein [Fibrobacteria bacterium]
MEVFTIVATVLGILFMFLELILPGGISFCVGLSTIAVGLGYQFGLVTGPFNMFLSWCGLSVVSAGIGIFIVNKMFAGSSVEDSFDEDVENFGKPAVALEDIDESDGRIQFQGTSWKAVCSGGAISKGSHVKIAGRINLTYIVELNLEEQPLIESEN